MGQASTGALSRGSDWATRVFALDGDIYPSKNDSSWIPYWRQGRVVASVSIDGNGESVPTADANRYVWRPVRFPLATCIRWRAARSS